MSKFRIVKKFSLDFISSEWKEAYINFNALTVGDVKDAFPALSKVSETKEEDVSAGLDMILDVLKDKFVDGKGINENGELIDLVADDIKELPISVLSKALSFLSQDATIPSPKE